MGGDQNDQTPDHFTISPVSRTINVQLQFYFLSPENYNLIMLFCY